MASSTLSIFFSSLLVLLTLTNAKTPPKPKGFIFPIKKATNQYYTNIQIGTSNITSLNVVIDLGGKFLWFNSDDYLSSAASSYRVIICDTPLCTTIGPVACMFCFVGPFSPNCTENACTDYALNPFSGTRGYTALGQDTLHVYSPRGDHFSMSNFPFQFSDPVLLNGLARPVSGLVGLGRAKSSLQAQLASTFRIREKFAICLPSSGSDGSMIFGKGNYVDPLKVISTSLIDTPLIRNPVSTLGDDQIGKLEIEYFINVKSIRVDNKTLSFNNSLLSIDKNTGDGGTCLRTVRPYTILHKSIFDPLVDEFVKAAESKNITRVTPVAPFEACFDAKTITEGNTGPDVPVIDLVLQNENVYWRFYGPNSMVGVGNNVTCLAFVEGKTNIGVPTTSIVVGGYQMENYLLEFDVASSRLRFSSSLLLHETSCSRLRAH